ncbi:ribonuclease HIII [Pontibacillus halophilus JSM 076056 = DSM 19796]|uniref:Ribonuclease HIII n=1 Tax=Pontibacillus halophilus JSM 076056 = DSM 19796 TaxID=1385510 RepID=A0A0A5GQA4_9BACI|nr:ribonuclease HIII [Pontibacillus halophilus]KGX93418.1 ribonuclease HIII [Pontibacillus halophilus JSM 076056 = DSM 19796]
MSQTVITCSQGTIQQMKETYGRSLKQKTPQGAVFSAKVDGCSITAYRSGKVMFQGPNHDFEAARWNGNSASPKKKSSSQQTTSPYYPKASLLTSSHGGSDEAGTGDYFGPITVASVYVTEEQISTLKKAGVRDSKDLKDPQIQQIAKRLVELEIPYSLITLHNEKYNRLQRKGWTQGKMKTMLHHAAINKLSEKIAPIKMEGFVIDQFAEPNIYKRHLYSENQTLQDNVYFMMKAESHSIAVAAASIIARSAFVKQMNKLSDKAGIELPKGASRRVDQTAGALIKQIGADGLEEFAKVHFANTEKALHYVR